MEFAVSPSLSAAATSLAVAGTVSSTPWSSSQRRCRSKTGDRGFLKSMLVLIYELLPTQAREQILADGARASGNIVDLFTRKPRG